MFISKFSSENWENKQNISYLKPAKNWQEIEDEIKALDGNHRTLVTLEADGESHLAIGGGPNNFIVYLTFDNETFYYLLNDSNFSIIPDSNLEEKIVVGGQLGMFSKKICVENMNTILQVSKTFAEKGKLDGNFRWKREGYFSNQNTKGRLVIPHKRSNTLRKDKRFAIPKDDDRKYKCYLVKNSKFLLPIS